MSSKIDRHGQVAILSPTQIELLFTDGLQADRDRTLFGVCLYTAARIAEACSMLSEDVYTSTRKVRDFINIRKAATKGKLATRTIPVIEDLRSLLIVWQPHAGQTYLFPGRHTSHHFRHITSDSAAVILREACKRVGIEGASTHSFRRTALTQMSNAGIPLRVIQQVSGHRTLTELQKYLEVSDAQVRGAVSALSMLSYGGKPRFSDAQNTHNSQLDDRVSIPNRGLGDFGRYRSFQSSQISFFQSLILLVQKNGCFMRSPPLNLCKEIHKGCRSDRALNYCRSAIVVDIYAVLTSKSFTFSTNADIVFCCSFSA